MSKINADEYKSFESIKQTSADGAEFWYARERAGILQYTELRNFHKAIERAMLACKNSGYVVSQCFVGVNKTSKMPLTKAYMAA